MENWLVKLNSDLGDHVVQNWSKVQYDGEYGYMSRLGRGIYLFVALDYTTVLVGKNKTPNHRQAVKWWKKLYKHGWIYPIRVEYNAPFGQEFENHLPFTQDSDVITLAGGK